MPENEMKDSIHFLSHHGLVRKDDDTTKPGLPDSGFYPEISGFFEADGIFLGNFFLAKNLGKNRGNSQEKFT